MKTKFIICATVALAIAAHSFFESGAASKSFGIWPAIESVVDQTQMMQVLHSAERAAS